MNLKNKVIVLTGASRGLGRALALKLAKEEAVIALLPRSESQLKDLKAEINKSGGKSEYFVCDVSDPNQVKKTFDEIVKKHKTIDILINNAGVWYQGQTTEHTDEVVKKVFEVNILGMIYCTKRAIPVMKNNTNGEILNIMSTAALHPAGDWGFYTGSKYAGRGFTESLREELAGNGIKVMAFYPGGMDTDLFFDAGFNKRHEDWMLKLEDVTDTLIFMLTRPDDVVVESLSLRKFNK